MYAYPGDMSYVTLTAVASVSRPTMLVGGASTTKSAVVLQLPALMKQTGIRLAYCMLCVHTTCPALKKTESEVHNIMHAHLDMNTLLFSYTQLNGTNTTYVDVCPLLEPSSTPTRDYVHPVGVDRDIQLQTRNLPAPVSAELPFSIPKHFVSALIPSPNHADQWIQL